MLYATFISFILLIISMLQNNQNPYAVISVTEPVMQKSATDSSSYVTYLIIGEDPHGKFHVRHRFREFVVLRDKLVQRFIGMYIPPIPSKKASGNTQEKYVQQRRKYLNYFCLKIARKPYIFDSDIFQTFIRGDPDFERAARFISGHQYALIANIYGVQFGALAQQLDLTKITVEIQQQGENMRKIQKRFTAIRSQIQEVLQVKRQYVNQYSQCYKNILPRFQKAILTKHGDLNQQVFLSQNQLFSQKLSQYILLNEDNPLNNYVQSLSYDIRQCRAFVQAIQTRRLLQNKKVSFESARRESKEQLQRLKSGRMSIKSLFTSGSKENQIKQLENYIPKYERNQSFVGMCLPLSAIAIHRDIQEFKKSRSVEYLNNLQLAACKELRMLHTYIEMLKASKMLYSPKQDPIPEAPEVKQQKQVSVDEQKGKDSDEG